MLGWRLEVISPTTIATLDIQLTSWYPTGRWVWQPELSSREDNEAKCKELRATSSNKVKAVVLSDLYGRMNLNLARANATAILTRCFTSDI
ncbi:hypothetical protein EMCRGX_G029018 [Ephydatia muelleri]